MNVESGARIIGPSLWVGIGLVLLTIPGGGCYRTAPALQKRALEGHGRRSRDVLLRLPPSGRTSVPFRKGLNHVLVKARSESGKELTFFLDTGASLSVVTPALLREVKLPVVAGVKVGAAVGAHGRLRGGPQLRELRNLRVGELRIERAHAAVVDLGHVGKAFGEPIHGILGFNVLSRLITVIDYPAQRVTFIDPKRRDHLRRLGPPQTVVPFAFRNGTFIEVPGSVNGAPEAPFVFDIGARGTVLNGAAARAAGVRFAGAVDSPGSPGRHRARRGRVASFRVGSLKFVRPVLHQLDLPVFRHLGIAGQPGGLVGNDILARFRVAIDYARQRLVFWRR